VPQSLMLNCYIFSRKIVFISYMHLETNIFPLSVQNFVIGFYAGGECVLEIKLIFIFKKV
jgi:hypothetical protein